MRENIGGVTLLRAAAKNHARVAILSDPTDYSKIIEELKQGNVTQETRNALALKVFVYLLSMIYLTFNS